MGPDINGIVLIFKLHLSIVDIMILLSCSVASVIALCDPMDSSLAGSSAHGISQAKILEWVVTSLSRGSLQPRDQAYVSCIGRWVLYH